MKVDLASLDCAGRRNHHPARALAHVPQRIYGVDPTNKMIRANGELAQNGWSNIPEVETEVATWYDAKTSDEEKAAVRRLKKVALDHGVYAPLGSYLRHFAWRKNGNGVMQGPLPFFWGVSKSG
jgi:peptide/nickel transport system substrate-binding protein